MIIPTVNSGETAASILSKSVTSRVDPSTQPKVVAMKQVVDKSKTKSRKQKANSSPIENYKISNESAISIQKQSEIKSRIKSLNSDIKQAVSNKQENVVIPTVKPYLKSNPYCGPSENASSKFVI